MGQKTTDRRTRVQRLPQTPTSARAPTAHGSLPAYRARGEPCGAGETGAAAGSRGDGATPCPTGAVAVASHPSNRSYAACPEGDSAVSPVGTLTDAAGGQAAWGTAANSPGLGGVAPCDYLASGV